MKIYLSELECREEHFDIRHYAHHRKSRVQRAVGSADALCFVSSAEAGPVGWATIHVDHEHVPFGSDRLGAEPRSD